MSQRLHLTESEPQVEVTETIRVAQTVFSRTTIQKAIRFLTSSTCTFSVFSQQTFFLVPFQIKLNCYWTAKENYIQKYLIIARIEFILHTEFFL